MAHYLHHDDEAKQDAQIKRIKRRKQATRSERLSEWLSRVCQNGNQSTRQVFENIGAGEALRLEILVRFFSVRTIT